MKKLYSLILLLFLTGISNATEYQGKHNKQKTIKKTVDVNPTATLSVENKYGNVFVTTWDQDKIDIEVIVTISGDDEKWVNARLASINVEFAGNSSSYSAKTIFDEQKNYGKKSSMEINYTIKIPKKGNLKVKNNYGNIITHELFGSTDILCKYGKITLGKLNHSSNTIQIEYCSKSNIERINNGNVIAKYSDLQISDYNSLDLNSSYTDVVLTKGTNLKYVSKYGKLLIGSVANVGGSGDYMTIKVNELNGSLNINTKYSNLTVNAISSAAKDLTINAGYTNVFLSHDSNYAFDFDVTTKYGNFKSEAPLEYNSRIETNSSKTFKGFHKKSGSNQVTINSSYGNISLKQL
jgi:hypothetical protein